MFLLFTFLMLVLFFTLVAVFLLCVSVALVFAGVISTTVVTVLHSRSAGKNFRRLIVSGFALFGFAGCAIAFPLFNKILHWVTFQTALFSGMAIGLLSGAVVGFFIFKLLRFALILVIEKLKIKNS